MNDIPSEGLLRVKQILRIIPISRTSWWAGVKSGRFPKPLKLSSRVTVWRIEDIRKVIAGHKDFS